MKKTLTKAHPNIAFIKYWGKKESQSDLDRNLGLNPSVSMTLSQATTEVIVERADKAHEIFIDSLPANPMDVQKISAHIQRICETLNVKNIPLRIDSKNNFPKGTGIASSASAFAALSFGISSFLTQDTALKGISLETLSELSRRGSGSACRSVAGPFMKWEKNFAERIDSSWKLFDTIVIFSKSPKSVSSSEGHKRVLSSPFWKARTESLAQRYQNCLSAIASKDIMRLGQILETEALEMHKIAETSVPPIQYRSAETLKFLEALSSLKDRNFFFTIDAGPNLHFLSEKPIKQTLLQILTDLQIEASLWEDWTGDGPVVKELL